MRRVVIVWVVGALVGCTNARNDVRPPTAGAGGDALARRFNDCWAMWNASKFDQLESCFAVNATSEAPGSGLPAVSGASAIVEVSSRLRESLPDLHGEPVLELVNRHRLAAIVFVSGTQTASFKLAGTELPASNKKIGILLAQVIELDDTGHVTHEANYFDFAGLVGQIRPTLAEAPMAKTIVIANDEPLENANLAAAKAVIEAFNRHDTTAFGDLLAEDAVWSEQQQPHDDTKEQVLADLTTTWQSVPDLTIVPVSMWSAGGYVVTVERDEGTVTNKHVAIPALSIARLANGKIEAVWAFVQSSALPMQLGLLPAPTLAAPASTATTLDQSNSPDKDSWAARCVVEMTKGRDAAAKLRSSIKSDEVRTNRPASGGTVVFLDDQDFGAAADLGGSDATIAAHPTWFDAASAEGHRKGHWFWVRGYANGQGSVTFDGRPEAHVHVEKAMEIMKKAIDRCFADASPH